MLGSVASNHKHWQQQSLKIRNRHAQLRLVCTDSVNRLTPILTSLLCIDVVAEKRFGTKRLSGGRLPNFAIIRHQSRHDAGRFRACAKNNV